MLNSSTPQTLVEQKVAENISVEVLESRLESAWSMGSDSTSLEHESPTQVRK
ncbi:MULTISPECIES: hypothetical protein [Hymenobacter]|uniref:Uncharacterized protein n=1 Tax=Hymenobacter guriensis TaxID=2793065 RepID=A0ABS0L4J2_9BACT|nr:MULTISPECIES: hypothetical protein [Hymenobacter]MBG8555056.1 hypothetical protein [Hymenobacter guriensis]MCR5890386.1 hypothetical protein [Hymenobacter sp. J193]